MRRPALLLVLVLLFWTHRAHAERDLIVPFEEGGHLVLDQLAGMHIDGITGVGFAGPVGIAYRQEGDTKTTTAWLAPSADLFVLEHLSLGGAIEIAHTWASGSASATTMSFVPRVGFYVPVSDRLGIWPRAGLGYTRVEDGFEGMRLEADVGVVYRFDETFFMKAGPGVATTLGGEHTLQVSGGVGFGVNLEL